MSTNSQLDELYRIYSGDWRRFFNDVSRFWKDRAQADSPSFEQPFLFGCPWCGIVPEVRLMPVIQPETFSVDCRNFKCPRRTAFGKTPEEAARQWNTRVDVKDQSQRLNHD